MAGGVRPLLQGALGVLRLTTRLMAAKPLVIENHTDSGIEWLVSFEGCNPSEERSVRCYSRSDAEKLVSLICER
jgi:hypothetical protein